MISLIPIQGEASYYRNEEFPGITASGEQFDDTQLTFAMLTGEFDQYYLIVAETGVIIARLNDRGPYIKGRIIDLSEAAMEQIKGDGLIDVMAFKLPFCKRRI